MKATAKAGDEGKGVWRSCMRSTDDIKSQYKYKELWYVPNTPLYVPFQRKCEGVRPRNPFMLSGMIGTARSGIDRRWGAITASHATDADYELMQARCP